jgi:hypothetical protein
MNFLGVYRKPLVPVFFVLVFAHSTHAQSTNAPTKENVDQLIQQLASGDFKDRERATNLLLQRQGVTGTLKKALSSADLEVATRIKWILQQKEQRHARQGLARLKPLGKLGTMDQVAELLAQWPVGYDEATCWQELRTLLTLLLALHQKDTAQPKLALFAANGLPDPKVFAGPRITKGSGNPEDIQG